MYENEILSYAFSKSIRRIIPLVLFSLAYSIISFVVLTTSPIYLPATNLSDQNVSENREQV